MNSATEYSVPLNNEMIKLILSLGGALEGLSKYDMIKLIEYAKFLKDKEPPSEYKFYM